MLKSIEFGLLGQGTSSRNVENILKRTNRGYSEQMQSICARNINSGYKKESTFIYSWNLYLVQWEAWKYLFSLNTNLKISKRKDWICLKILLSKISNGFSSVFFEPLCDHDEIEQHRRCQDWQPRALMEPECVCTPCSVTRGKREERESEWGWRSGMSASLAETIGRIMVKASRLMIRIPNF